LNDQYFTVEVPLYATMTVRARSPEEAGRIGQAMVATNILSSVFKPHRADVGAITFAPVEDEDSEPDVYLEDREALRRLAS